VKKLLTIILFIILALVVFINIKNTSKKEDEMPREEIIPERRDSVVVEEESLPNLFPDIYDPASLNIDKNLPIVRIKNLADTLKTNSPQINIEFQIPNNKRKVDLYLFVNEQKRDMFYQVGSGIGAFKNVSLQNGENIIELFYRLAGKRSSSSYSVVIRE
jgi:hypothetical protein